MDTPKQEKAQVRWRPIPGCDGFEMSEKGEVAPPRRLLLPADDGTVTMRTPEGRKVRSVKRLLAEVWPEVLPEIMRRPAPMGSPAKAVQVRDPGSPSKVESDAAVDDLIRRAGYGPSASASPPVPIEVQTYVTEEQARRIIKTAACALG